MNFENTPVDLQNLLLGEIETSEANSINVSNIEVIGFNVQTALAFITLSEAASFLSATTKTRTIVLQTLNSGESWSVTLNTDIVYYFKIY